MPKGETTYAQDLAAEVLSLRNQIREMEAFVKRLTDENHKLNTQCEELLSELEKRAGKIRFLEGQIEAYQYCMNCRR